MMNTSSSRTPTNQILAIVCFGLFAGAMALNALQTTEAEVAPTRSVIWNAFQYGMPLLIGGICLIGKRWSCMIAVIYGTVGLALDIATLAQGVTEETGSASFIVVIMTTGLLNVALIILGGKGLLSPSEQGISSNPSH